jgi:hypothetical protein
MARSRAASGENAMSGGRIFSARMLGSLATFSTRPDRCEACAQYRLARTSARRTAPRPRRRPSSAAPAAPADELDQQAHASSEMRQTGKPMPLRGPGSGRSVQRRKSSSRLADGAVSTKAAAGTVRRRPETRWTRTPSTTGGHGSRQPAVLTRRPPRRGCRCRQCDAKRQPAGVGAASAPVRTPHQSAQSDRGVDRRCDEHRKKRPTPVSRACGQDVGSGQAAFTAR